ncbi:DUF6082 family protein [Streptomyces sp. NBC_01381]|uniref:DUF6082 family protein n=1 Tax=Streptomyces sp. NBC_01381 TaxID=2903845 RepID=UPI0022502392|nr:DUF6082 family protein [Streptomyces sp. NBC_01381]MCX4670531.1 DUF6082 family protein [Streptomyces sp. NBC_01381]
MATQIFGIRGLSSATGAGLAFAAGAFALLAAQQRRYAELRIQVDRAERADWRRTMMAEQQELQLYLLRKAIDDPDLAAVFSIAEADSPAQQRQFLFANALYTNALLAYRIGVVNWEELHGHLRVMCANPIFRQYWHATRHQRASLKDSSDEAKVGHMTDAIIHDLEESESDEWWVIGEPPSEGQPPVP